MGKGIYAGIDPGEHGAIAMLGSIMGEVQIYDFDDANGLVSMKAFAKDMRVVIEKVGAMPKQGVASTFKFGTNFGIWIGRLEALGIVFDFATPQKWQKAVFDSAVRKGMDRKRLSLDRARRLFPQAGDLLARKMDHNRADALLMAEYCRRIYS